MVNTNIPPQKSLQKSRNVSPHGIIPPTPSIQVLVQSLHLVALNLCLIDQLERWPFLYPAQSGPRPVPSPQTLHAELPSQTTRCAAVHTSRFIFRSRTIPPSLTSMSCLSVLTASLKWEIEIQETNEGRRHPTAPHPLLARPIFAPLVFTNEQSDVRDHCANERTFLSWLRLATYMAIVSVAIIINFHLKSKPSAAEKKAALPLGLVFWVLSLGCLGSGIANYFRTVESYGRRAALVQSGWKTQIVFTVVAAAIIAACVFFLSVDASGNADKRRSILSLVGL